MLVKLVYGWMESSVNTIRDEYIYRERIYFTDIIFRFFMCLCAVCRLQRRDPGRQVPGEGEQSHCSGH